MTPGNKKRLKMVADDLLVLIEKNKDAQMAAITLLNVQRGITEVVQDLVFRPEANDKQ